MQMLFSKVVFFIGYLPVKELASVRFGDYSREVVAVVTVAVKW